MAAGKRVWTGSCPWTRDEKPRNTKDGHNVDHNMPLAAGEGGHSPTGRRQALEERLRSVEKRARERQSMTYRKIRRKAG